MTDENAQLTAHACEDVAAFFFLFRLKSDLRPLHLDFRTFVV
jgi:hypothetical protein